MSKKTQQYGHVVQKDYFVAIYCFSLVQAFEMMLFPSYPAGIYIPKVNNRNTRARCEIC